MPGFIITSHRVINVEDIATIRLLPDKEGRRFGFIEVRARSESGEDHTCTVFSTYAEARAAFRQLRDFVCRTSIGEPGAFNLSELSTFASIGTSEAVSHGWKRFMSGKAGTKNDAECSCEFFAILDNIQ